MNVYEVGKKFPGPIPPQDGLTFEIGPDGDMQLLIQKPSKSEGAALADGFRKYSLCRYQAGNVVLACWVFKYPAPVMYMDAPFYAGLYTDDRIQKFLATEQNALYLTNLDGEIVQRIKMIGLQWETIIQFRDIIREQALNISRSAYNAAIDSMYQLSSKEIFERGTIYNHRSDS